MLQKLEIHGVHYNPDDNLQKYIQKKIGRLDKYIPSHSRESAHATVYVEEAKTHGDKQYECEVVIHLPKEEIRVRDGTLNMYAAVDIVEAKLKLALQRYKTANGTPNRIRHMLRRYKRQVGQ